MARKILFIISAIVAPIYADQTVLVPEYSNKIFAVIIVVLPRERMNLFEN